MLGVEAPAKRPATANLAGTCTAPPADATQTPSLLLPIAWGIPLLTGVDPRFSFLAVLFQCVGDLLAKMVSRLDLARPLRSLARSYLANSLGKCVARVGPERGLVRRH